MGIGVHPNPAVAIYAIKSYTFQQLKTERRRMLLVCIYILCFKGTYS